MNKIIAGSELQIELIDSCFQNKDLKSRLSHLEGSQRTNQDSLVSKLNSRIQELEERLQGEERSEHSAQILQNIYHSLKRTLIMSLSVCGFVEKNSVRYNALEKEPVDILGHLKHKLGHILLEETQISL